jgi:transcriptional regulator with AAA-type ATPase domain
VGQSRSSSDEPAPSALELVVVAGDAIRLTTLPACDAVTLGRGEECEVRIDNRSVSRRHAVLHLGPPLRLQDLGSANGTFVHDTRTPRNTASTHPLRKLSKETIEIEIGARVSLGSIPIVIRRAAAERQPHAAPDHIVVRDPGMRVLYEQLTRVARSTISVLVLGETGVGKEVLARRPRSVAARAGAIPRAQLRGTAAFAPRG